MTFYRQKNELNICTFINKEKQENSLFQTQNTADLNKITDTSAIITNHMRSPDNTPNASLMTYQIYCYYQFSTCKLCSRQHPSNYDSKTGDYSEITAT